MIAELKEKNDINQIFGGTNIDIKNKLIGAFSYAYANHFKMSDCRFGFGVEIGKGMDYTGVDCNMVLMKRIIKIEVRIPVILAATAITMVWKMLHKNKKDESVTN